MLHDATNDWKAVASERIFMTGDVQVSFLAFAWLPLNIESAGEENSEALSFP
jgi:hypothetical protein